LESYPKVKEVIESLSFMSRILDHQEREVNKNIWNDYDFERINKGREYFHFISFLYLRTLRIRMQKCFGQLIEMWEAFAIVNPNFIRSKLNEYNQSIPEGVKYLREKAQVLFHMG